MELSYWRDVLGFEGFYKVSQDGFVRSVPRESCGRMYGGRVIKQQDVSGYKRVCLSVGNKVSYRFVHILVLDAFVSLRPEGMQACHNNGNRADNKAENLRWDSAVENAKDKSAHGTHLFGSTHPQHKLTEEAVIEIRRLVPTGSMTITSIAEKYGVSRRAIRLAAIGFTWRHV